MDLSDRKLWFYPYIAHFLWKYLPFSSLLTLHFQYKIVCKPNPFFYLLHFVMVHSVCSSFKKWAAVTHLNNCKPNFFTVIWFNLPFIITNLVKYSFVLKKNFCITLFVTYWIITLKQIFFFFVLLYYVPNVIVIFASFWQ